MTSRIVEIVTTVSTEADAEELARALVQSRHAACVSIARIRSLYRWQDAIQDEDELQIVVKTLAERAEETERRILELHPYETPQVLRLDVAGASDAYSAWVAACVTGEDEGS